MQTVAKASQLAARKPAFDITTTAQIRDLALTMAKLCGWDGKPSVTTYYKDDNRQVIVCPPERRQQLIEQRQRLLEQEATGRVIELNGHKAKAAVTVTIPAQETQLVASVDTGKGVVARNQRPTAKQDPLSQWRDSVGRAQSWKTNEPEHNAAMFGPHQEEPY
jgi:ribosomal protein L14E/L6E/L27E